MNEETRAMYETLIAAYQKTGRIGQSKPYNLDEARRQAYAVANSMTRRQQIDKTPPRFIHCCQPKQSLAYIQLKLNLVG